MNRTDKSNNSIFGKDALFSQRYRSGTPHHIKKHSTHNPIHKALLKLRNLSLEILHLLPAIQRPSVIQSQTTSHIRLGLCNASIQLR